MFFVALSHLFPQMEGISPSSCVLCVVKLFYLPRFLPVELVLCPFSSFLSRCRDHLSFFNVFRGSSVDVHHVDHFWTIAVFIFLLSLFIFSSLLFIIFVLSWFDVLISST